MKKTLLAVILLLWVACDDNNNPETGSATSFYLPLAVGNYWVFRSINGTKPVQKREVNSKIMLDGHLWYLLTSTIMDNDGNVLEVDSSYYRIESNGYVYVKRDRQSGAQNRYRLAARDGDTWSYSLPGGVKAHIDYSLSSIKVGNDTVRDCKVFSFDVREWADEEYSYSLAPGVGFIKEYSTAWGVGIELKEAFIDGQLIPGY